MTSAHRDRDRAGAALVIYPAADGRGWDIVENNARALATCPEHGDAVRLVRALEAAETAPAALPAYRAGR